MIKSRREQLVQEIGGKLFGRNEKVGSHSKEANVLLRMRSLIQDCLDLVPRTGCENVSKRSLYWNKLEMLKDQIGSLVQNAADWDALNLTVLLSKEEDEMKRKVDPSMGGETSKKDK